MNMPSSGMVDHSGPNLHKPPDYGLYGRLYPLAPECTIPDHVEQVVGQASDKKPRLIRCKSVATRLVPAEGIFPFFYPVFNLGAAIVNRNYPFRFKMRVGHDKSDAGEEFTRMPFYFTDNPSRLIPFLRLVIKFDHPYLNAALWGATCGPVQVRLDELLEAVIAGKTDEVGDPILFAKLVQVRTGKSGITPEPKALEPRPVALNKRGDKVHHAFG
jgi:hypothetical protein